MRLLDADIGMQYIPFDSGRVPYSFPIKLYDRTYELDFSYNESGGFFTVDLATFGVRSEALCAGEVLRYGKPLFEAYNDERYPLPVIVPLCLTGERIEEITRDNMGREVRLYLYPRPTGGG